MRLIDADALKEKAFFHEIDNVSYVEEEDIDKAPTVDAVEWKRGEWINDKGLYRCSACNELWVGWWAIIVPIERMNKEMRFCPHCGAEMGGEANEAD